MDRILQAISNVVVRFSFICLFAVLIVLLGGLLMDVYYGRWSAALPRVRITDHVDSIQISWGPMHRYEFPGKSLLLEGGTARYFFQTYPSYFAAKEGSWEGIIMQETVLEHIVGGIRLLVALRAGQSAFEVREGKLYQLVVIRPTWYSRTVHRWEEKVLSGDVAWALQQSRRYLRHHKGI